MAGGQMKYRHLGVKSSHRQALLRNLVSSLIEHESITTTLPKAKEAQRFAEKLISLGKRNTNAARNRAMGILYRPLELMPKLFGPIRERYASRPGGYTRVLRTEPRKEDGAPTAVLELVDGPRDMRFMMTAMTVARERDTDKGVQEITAQHIDKATRFRPGGKEDMEAMVKMIEERRNEWKSRGLEEEVEARRQVGDRKEKVYQSYNMLRRGERQKKWTRQ